MTFSSFQYRYAIISINKTIFQISLLFVLFVLFVYGLERVSKRVTHPEDEEIFLSSKNRKSWSWSLRLSLAYFEHYSVHGAISLNFKTSKPSRNAFRSFRFTCSRLDLFRERWTYFLPFLRRTPDTLRRRLRVSGLARGFYLETLCSWMFTY